MSPRASRARGKKVRGTLTAAQLAARVTSLGPREAAELIESHDDTVAVAALQRLSPAVAGDVLPELDAAHRALIYDAAPIGLTQQWSINLTFRGDSVGRLMDTPPAVFAPDETVEVATERVREVAKEVMLTYCWVVDAAGHLVGIVTMRDLVVAEHSVTLDQIMLREVFTLSPTTSLADAMRSVVSLHYPVYPVVDETGRLLGQVRGSVMFEETAFENSAQPGRMVGVDEEERLLTPWLRSLRFRHPWLQLNLLTAFLAAAVVGVFQNTLDRMVILAVFLPVLAGQSGNTGCQALAVTLRGMTLGELQAGAERALIAKEALLGLLNGTLVGVTAGLGMYFVATMQGTDDALSLAGIVMLAMIASCVISGIAGALIPLMLRRAGADPATASSIFLTTATDVASMGMFLGLATLLL
jgi:magnesium transporter